MPIECLILFDNNPQAVYYAGQELSGSVDLTVDTTKKIKAIHITVRGFAKIRWLKKGYTQNPERSICRGYRSYLASRSYVLGTNDSPCIDLLAGVYTYTFRVVLPPTIPTSFDGKYGQIHYEIVTAIDRPGRCTKNFRLPFSVIKPVDLNADPIYRVPLEMCNREHYWSFCCPTGPLSVKFNTLYNGYAPGQKINFVLFVDNESAIDFTEASVRFRQEVTYESREPHHEYRYDKHPIVVQTFGTILRWTRKIFYGSLHLPSIPPSCTLNECPIRIEYVIKIVVKPTSFHRKFKMKIPITIGTVPIILDSLPAIRNSMNDRQSFNRLTPPPTIIVTLPAENDTPPEYVPMVLPTYNEAITVSPKFVDEDSESFTEINEDKISMFIPRYPVYSSTSNL